MTTDVARLIGHARRELEDAIAALHPLLPHATASDQAPNRGDPGCLACRKAGFPHVASGPVSGACRWHYDFRRKYGKDPSNELVDRHHAGYFITPAMVAGSVGKTPPKARKPKPPPTRRARMLNRVKEAGRRIGVGG